MDPNDPRYPMAFSKSLEWTFTIVCAFSTLGVSLASSAYAGGTNAVISSFDVSTEVATLGVSLFVLGFAVGTLIWAPLSELYGRQIVFLVSYLGLAVFCAGATGSKKYLDVRYSTIFGWLLRLFSISQMQVRVATLILTASSTTLGLFKNKPLAFVQANMTV
jgi:MFS family permease